MHHVIMWSGGITSWAVARQVADLHSTESMTLLFADTLIEDEDLYRWNRDASADIGVDLTVVTDGRTPAQANADRKWLGSARLAHCSEILKQKPCREWLKANTDPSDSTVYVGIDWTELHRLPAIEAAYQPWTAVAPLTEPPYIDKRGWMAMARRRGLELPRMYELGYPHNNCGGACVKAGQAQWLRTLKVFPDRFAAAEKEEQAFRAEHGKDVAYLTEVVKGEKKPLPLVELRRRSEARDESAPPLDFGDWGGCGCLPA